VLRAFVVSFGVVVILFGVSFACVSVRQRERDLRVWALAHGGFNIAVGATVLVGSLLRDALPYAVGAVGLFLVAKVAARRKLKRSPG
jgi:uncharacterized membrane protein HdeD (DUF308 family)